MKGFPGLKVQWAVLYLDQNIFPELSIQRFEFIVGLFEAVLRFFITIYESPPHDKAMVRGDSICEHVSTIRMCPSICLRTWLSFGISFYKKAAKIRNVFIDLIHFIFPPLLHIRIQRICR